MARSRDDFVPIPLAVELGPGTPVGEFVITQKLGQGGMATVYGAVHPVIGKHAAVKVLAPALSTDQGQVARFSIPGLLFGPIGDIFRGVVDGLVATLQRL